MYQRPAVGPTTASSAHGEWEPASDRRDPAELLEEQAASPVPELVPIHYGRMLVSPFTFFRGAAYPMTPIWPAHPEPGWTCSSAAMPIVMGRRRTGQR